MNAKEKYDSIIADIEELAADRYKSKDEIIEFIIRKNALNSRDLTALFSFMTGDTVVEYVKKRKLMAAYRHLITAPELNRQLKVSCVEISGLNDDSAFGKKFKQVFSINPKAAFYAKDSSLLTPPLTWDAVSCTVNKSYIEEDDDDKMNAQIMFGVAKEQYDRIIEAYDLEGLYGFAPIFSQVAIEISDKLGVSFADAFSYVDSLRDYGGDYSGKYDDPECPYFSLRPAIDNLREDAYDEFLQFAFFECDISVCAASELPDRTGFDERELMKLDPEMIHKYALVEGFNFEYFMRAYEYYMQNRPDDYGDEEFDQYIEWIDMGYAYEYAFISIVPENDYVDYISYSTDYDDFEEIETILREEDENIRWSGVRIDEEYDEENPSYD